MVTSKQNDERMIVLFLGCIAVVCIVGIIALEAFAGGTQSDALLTIGSLCVGALASRFTGYSGGGRHASQRSTDDPDQDAFEIIGRAATKQIINDALRKMEGSAD